MVEQENPTPDEADKPVYRGAVTDLAIAVGGAAIYDAGKAGYHQLKEKVSGSQGTDKPKD
jgi:hypothetical protein